MPAECSVDKKQTRGRCYICHVVTSVGQRNKINMSECSVGTQSPIQFRHQTGALTTELLSVVDSIYTVRTYIPCGVKFLREFNFADRRFFFLRLQNIGFPAADKFLQFSETGSCIVDFSKLLLCPVTTFAGPVLVRLPHTITVKFLLMALVLANDKKPGKILTANLCIAPFPLPIETYLRFSLRYFERFKLLLVTESNRSIRLWN